MLKQILFTFSLLFLTTLTWSQIVSLNPSSVGPDDAVILTFDASEGNGELVGESKVYIHHGAVIDAPDGTEWTNVIGNWGADDGVGEMTPVSGETDKWQIEMTPSIRAHFGVPANENIFRISAVFRSADGSTKGTTAPGEYGWGEVAANQDFFIDLNVSDFISFNAPVGSQSFVELGEDITISAFASSPVTEMKVWIDEGSGFVEQASVTSGTSIEAMYTPSTTGLIDIRVTATVNSQNLEIERSHNIILISDPVIESLPAGMVTGINYDPNDDTKATLVLQAPGKEYAYVVGDFTGWNVLDEYSMKQTPDGEYLWLELDDLTPEQPYVFQYWVEDDVKIGDPYAEQVADPWNDQFIEETVFPNIPVYDKTEYQTATVLQTGQEEYEWAPSEDTWQRPDVNHLVIYELLVRDFLESHSYDDLIDTLAYIKNLGVDAIELMPFNEFEGNESWGYNPSYYFAVDKYYGTPDDLRRFIEICHQQGLAVIMDMVLNHAYGQNALVKLYWENGKPAPDNPWFNVDHVGPFEWGYDFDHESQYTKDFMDRVNRFWIEEYHIDGYRFDFTKGFTNNAPGGSIDGYDQSRIDILKRMADVIWDTDPTSYVILEHWGPFGEEEELANYGMKMWRNRSYDYVPLANGNNTGNFTSMDALSHVSYFNSHDERRIAEHMLVEGLSNGVYNVKDPVVMYERAKMAAAFCFLFPGPKMMWQFDELGYDINIDFNGRTGNKPLPWGPDGLGYYEDPLRQHIYDAYRGIIDVRNQLTPQALNDAAKDFQLNGFARRLSYDLPGTDLVLVGNFGLGDESVDPSFTQTGTWYDYFSGDSIDVTNTSAPLDLKAGEWHIYTTERLSDGMPGVVEVFENPVTVTPYPFTKSETITIRFDATKASPNGTAGLVGAEKVYIHSGLIFDPNETDLQNVVGTLMDDGVGEMTEVSEDIWELTIVPKDYYGLMDSDEPIRIGMYFRDASNTNLGYGFRNSVIFVEVESEKPFVTIEPSAFTIDDEITVTFNARRGNQELVGSNKVYLHSSVNLNNTSTPWVGGWNYTVGNWGADDGVGEMTPVPGEDDLWQITLTPKDYYGLQDGDIAWWLSAVFRNADGSAKGTGTPGPIENGIIHTNQDFFLRNDIVISTEELTENRGLTRLFPNPADDFVNIEFEDITGEVQIDIIDTQGKLLNSEILDVQNGMIHKLSLQNLPKGIYQIQITGEDYTTTKQLVRL